MEKALAEALVIRRKLFVVKFVSDARNVSKECREFDVPRSSFVGHQSLLDNRSPK